MFIVRYGSDAVGVKVDDHGVRVLYGSSSVGDGRPDGINTTINLDWGEARELAESILQGMVERQPDLDESVVLTRVDE